jgi:hypothetical protein
MMYEQQRFLDGDNVDEQSSEVDERNDLIEQHDTIIANILRLQHQYQQQTSVPVPVPVPPAATHNNNNNNSDISTRFSKISPSSSLTTYAPIIARPIMGVLPSANGNHRFTNAARNAIIAYDEQLNREVDEMLYCTAL